MLVRLYPIYIYNNHLAGNLEHIQEHDILLHTDEVVYNTLPLVYNEMKYIW